MHASRPSVRPALLEPWREPRSFGDDLREWMRGAPWLALSLAFHLLVFFVLAAIPWERFRAPRETIVRARLAPEPPAFVEELPEPPPPEPERRELAEPELVDALVEAESEELEPLEPAPEADDLALVHFEELATDPRVLGAGPGPTGRYGWRRGGPRVRRRGGPGSEPAIARALDWLRAHQAPDGSWRAAAFPERCDPASAPCDGAGDPAHDVGVTGLALLAFLGEGSSSAEGPHRDVVARGVRFLIEAQDPDTGRIGERASHAWVYDHAIATLALAEAYALARTPLLRGRAQRAVDFVCRARDPYGAWRYDVPSLGDADTSITAWMLLALATARDAGLAVDRSAVTGGLAWIDAMTDPATGRVGYDTPGSTSSRTPANQEYPPERCEGLTAAGLLVRVFLEDGATAGALSRRQAELVARRPPVWDADARGVDTISWYYGAYALFQLGGPPWERWRGAMQRAIVPRQVSAGEPAGSWDPVGAWGYAGGRVASTALLALCLEVESRYVRVLELDPGARGAPEGRFDAAGR